MPQGAATTWSRFTATGSFGGKTCGVRVVACTYATKSAVMTNLAVCSGTTTSVVIPFTFADANRITQTMYFGEDGVPIRGKSGRAKVLVSGASAQVLVVWRNL
jgi:hypothetical protein